MLKHIQSHYFKVSILFIFLSTLAKLFIFSKDESKEKKEYQERFNNQYNIFAVPLPDKVSFADEPVPLDIFDVKESLDRELTVNTYWQSNTLLLFKRANRWLPTIENILKKNNVPDDFKYLAIIESSLTNATSPSGARGFWQFLDGTGKDLKLEINEDIDERNHIEKSTEAACIYLKKQYKSLGSWTAAAASYNMGPTGFRNQQNKQKLASYYDLHLNTETARYVHRIVALKLIMENPKAYGFHFREQDLYQPVPYVEVTVDSTISNLANFAIAQKSSYKYLRMLNPWLLTNTLPNKSRKSYTLRFPKKDVLNFKELDYIKDNLADNPE